VHPGNASQGGDRKILVRTEQHPGIEPGAADDRGDVFAKVEVRVPATLTDEEKAHYEALRALESK
jgi:hypothetical protein